MFAGNSTLSKCEASQGKAEGAACARAPVDRKSTIGLLPRHRQGAGHNEGGG